MANIAVVDAHQHFWDLQRNDYPWLRIEPPIPFRYGDYGAIRRNYLPLDYAADSVGFRVVKTVHVEAEWSPADPVGETRWLHEVHAHYGVPNAIVAQAWLDQDDAAEVIAKQAAFPLVRGIRHKPRAAPFPSKAERGAPGSMGDPKWRAGYALLEHHGLSFDLQTPYWHLPEALDLAAAFPRIQIIINHTGLPMDRSQRRLRAWYAAMKTLAAAPNVAVKISGLGLRGRAWRVDDQRSVVLDTIALFGVERCMFASNFPVDSLVGSFATIFNGFRDIVRGFSRTDQEKLFHENAVRIYRV